MRVLSHPAGTQGRGRNMVGWLLVDYVRNWYDQPIIEVIRSSEFAAG